jgi:hypothetical protein
MHLGALLVLIGTILCALSTFIPRAPLLAVGATLIGVGVLVGNTTLVTT